MITTELEPMPVSGLELKLRKPLNTLDLRAFHASVQADDVFICSYPKSGTTWVGYLLAQFFKRSDDDGLMGLNSFNDYVPDVNAEYFGQGTLDAYRTRPDCRVFLCHAPLDLQLPRVIYVLRDPRDAVVSYWHYKRFLSNDFKLSLAEFIATDQHWPCEWDQHAAGWLLPSPRHPRCLVIRYEDLHADTLGMLRKILDFSQIECSEQKMRRAVEQSRFERMRAAEEAHGVPDHQGDKRERFVRKGRIGGGREELGTLELELLERKYGRTMRALGYSGPEERS